MGDSGQSPVGQSEDGRYRLLVDAITDYAIYMIDPGGRITSWNAGAQRIKGYEASEIIGENFAKFYTEEDRLAGAPLAALKVAAATGHFEKEGWRVRKDGARFWAHVVIDPIKTATGEVLGYAKITRDLTERKAAEEALRRSQEQFRLLVEGVTDYAIYMLDPTGVVTSWNTGAERIKGYRSDEIVGDHFSRFYIDEDRERGTPATALSIAATTGRFEKEGWRVRKDGSRFWAHVIIDVIHDNADEVIGFAKITRDITERRDAQQALEEAREALFQAQKLEAIGQLTGGIAHDFNNLLMAVLGSLELVRKRLPHDPRITPLIDNAILGAERGAGLTQRMLAFARKQELKLEAVDLPALVQGMIGLLRTSLGPSIEVDTAFPRHLPPLHTDPNQLEAALLNLAVNARDAMPRGGAVKITAASVTVSETSGKRLAPGDYVCISVADSGQGMDADTLARAAEPFFTTKGVGKGTGLGLSMVHGLAQQSGGCFQIHSRLGEGTTVEVWLPVADLEGEPLAAAPTAREADGIEARSLVVLVVDDDNLVRINTVAMLEDLGHRVFSASGASDALAMLRRKPVDLVITDFAMPQMTGVELADSIAAQHPGTPVILATGYAELPQGAATQLPRLAKPFLQADLARAISRIETRTVAEV
jgi:PAS domain S-box-containing protein